MKNFLLAVPRSILVVLLFLLALRAILPIIGLRGINWALENKMGEYSGHIEDFDLSLYRGAYQLQGLEITKKKGHLPPFITAREIDLSLAWRALLHRQFLADVTVDGATLHLIDSKEKEKRQFGTEEKTQNWQSALDVLVPISIESLVVRDSSVYFTNNSLKKAVPVELETINIRVENLRTHAHNILSPFSAHAVLQKHAPISISGKLDVMSEKPRLDVDFQLTKFRVPTINDITLLYLPLDITKGELELYGEAAMSHGSLVGYTNVFFKEGDIIAQRQKFVSFKHFAYEILTAVGNWILKNSKEQSLAVHLPFEMHEGDKFKLDTSEILPSILDNRKGDFPTGIRNSVSLDLLEKKTTSMN